MEVTVIKCDKCPLLDIIGDYYAYACKHPEGEDLNFQNDRHENEHNISDGRHPQCPLNEESLTLK